MFLFESERAVLEGCVRGSEYHSVPEHDVVVTRRAGDTWQKEERGEDIEKYERMIKKTNQFTNHWYRKEGSRKKYTNEKPSFWAITGYTTPWAFLKNNKEGYHQFLESLKEMFDDEVVKVVQYLEKVVNSAFFL